MHVSKYYKHHSRYPANSDRSFHKVTHRHDMSIPGCTPAPREGIYRPEPIEKVRAELAARAERFIHALDTDQYGSSFRGNEFIEPLFGPYGNKL